MACIQENTKRDHSQRKYETPRIFLAVGTFLAVGMFLAAGMFLAMGMLLALGISRRVDGESQSQQSEDHLTSLRKVVGRCTAVEMGNKTLSSSCFALGIHKSLTLVVILHVVKKARPRFSTVERVPGTYSQTEYGKNILVFGGGGDGENSLAMLFNTTMC
jgi:hypothetical protein